MGQSSLPSGDRAIPMPNARHSSPLGPSNSSDSASDMAGVDETQGGVRALTVDVALGNDSPDDSPYGQPGSESRVGAVSDAVGTGDRRIAAGDAGAADAADIGVERAFAPDGDDPVDDQERSDDEDPDLAFIDVIQAADLLSEEDRPDEEHEAERQGNP